MSGVEDGPLRGPEDLVYHGCKRLLGICSILGCDRASDSAKSTNEDLSLDQKRDLLSRLHSVLLPLLDCQITKLSPFLDPLHLHEETASKYKQIADILSVLEATIIEFQYFHDTFCPESVSDYIIEQRNDDQHLQELKPFRLKGLDQYLRNDLYSELYGIFNMSSHITEGLRLSSPLRRAHSPSSPSMAHFRQSLLDHTSSSRNLIKLTREWIVVGSEFQLIRNSWLREVVSIDQLLVDFLLLIDSIHNKERNMQFYLDEVRLSEVVKLLIPVIRLSRLFYKKSSDGPVNGTRRPLFTEMDSNQLDCLSGTAREVRSTLEEILQLSKSYERENYNGDIMATKVDHIRNRLKDALLHLVLYFVPLIPETHGLPDRQNYYKSNWFIVWLTQLNLAVRNFTTAATSLPDNRRVILLGSDDLVV